MLSLQSALVVLTLLQVKHLIVDWIWQPPYEWSNKGTYGHFGGIRHAGKNALGTGLAFALGAGHVLSFGTIALIVLIDGVVHYHVDWGKMNLGRILGLKPDRDEQFWWLLGMDQYLHQITYIYLFIFVIIF